MGSANQVASGAEIVAGGVRFRLFSRAAEAVEVCLFDSTESPEKLRRPLTADGDGWWQTTVAGLGSGQLYGFRVHGPWDPAAGHRFNPAKLLVDPRALQVTGEPPLDESLRGSLPGDPQSPDPRDSGLAAPKFVVVDRHFDWRSDTPPAIPWQQTVIYECHVRGVTARHPGVPAELRGTYLGLASEPVLDHLERLGITTVELLPVQQIASEPHLLRHGLHNYFGYSPLAFFAPHSGYASEPGHQVAEFKEMVRLLHQRGIEVVVDTVFNHTAEGGSEGRMLSLRGIDNRTYYRLDPENASKDLDSTGCGNTIAAADPEVARFLLDCLRYWVCDMHVDGFRFDLAVALGRTETGFSVDSPFFQGLANDPVLSRVKLIAEPWDLGKDGYQLGSFHGGWLEWSDRFRDTTRKLWRGDRVLSAEIISMMSSPPLERPSIHFVTCHDGYTLRDLVSYEQKHNWANGEENRDGHNHNLSRNWGVEGATDMPEVQERRRQAAQNLLATTVLSAGVPMLLYGDESGRSQHGNNNAYCQDNELTWLDWSFDQAGEAMLAFTRELLALRKRLAPLTGPARVVLADGRRVARRPPPRPGTPLGILRESAESTFLIMINPSAHARLFRLPRLRQQGSWKRVLSTAHSGIRRLTGSTYRLSARSIAVAESVRRAS